IIYLFLALCCLSLGNLATNDYGLGYLARYHTIILLPAICLMVFGLQIIIQYLTTWEKKFKSQVLNLARWAKISIVILFLLPGQSWYLAQHVLQGHHNQILTTWQNLIGSELSTENIWLEDHDYLIFGGVLQNRALAAKFYGPSVTLNLPHRFPLFMVFFLPLGSMEKAAYLEPRFLEVAAQFREFDANLFDLGRYFQDKGHAIQTMIPAFLQRFPHYRQGLTYILPPPELASSLIPAHQTLDHYHHLALHLCQGLNHIQGPVPQEQNYFQKILLQDWQKFFQEYYYLLQVKQGPKASIITAAQLAQTVVPGVDPQLWRKLCHAISKEEMRKIKENKI
ncbi:MAG: hypothetical protein J6Y94_07585, partial [Bacteriovoracaceae bacterium]|nr:hypothetical protein [Bacteriovoracaceae bacterium]